MIKVALSAAALAAAFCFDLSAGPAHARGNAPWCSVVAVGTGDMEWDCEYQSAAECAPNVVAGNRGFCNVNPYYVASSAPERFWPGPHQRRHHRWRR